MLPPTPIPTLSLCLSVCLSKLLKIIMKQRYHSVSILLFLIISTSATARKLGAKQGEADVKTANSLSTTNHYMQTLDSFNKLMGLEYCQNGDEECLKRRAIAEAHLDYIYTQHHKP